MSDNKRRSLGRGLAALLGDEEEAELATEQDQDAGAESGQEGEARPTVRSDKMLPIAELHPNPKQPRRHFDEDALETLANSIKTNGLLQPILVRSSGRDGGGYEIVAGERRWRAAQQAQLHEVPVVIRDMDDRQALEIAIVENIQRRDLTPLEEAEGYRRLMEDFQHTQDAVAKAVAKSRSHIANMLRLLSLPDSVQQMVQAGRISAGHARALLSADDVEGLAREVAERGISVRETERLAQQVKAAAQGETASDGAAKKPNGKASAPASQKDADTRYLEDELSASLGLKVSIDSKGVGGKLTIEYGDLDQLDNVLAKLREPEPA